MTTFLNLTTHPITMYAGDTPIASWPPSGRFARAREARESLGTLSTDQGPIPLIAVRYTRDLIDLPEEAPGTAYIVSRVLAERVPRGDLYFPVDDVRDEQGRIVGCRGLGRFEAGPDAD